MKNSRKTIIFTLTLSLISIFTAFIVQFNGQNILSQCSYLDPISIDLLAFVAALFLVIEGIYRIDEHLHMPLKKQLTRAIRVAFGCAILTLHIMQFLHK